MAFPRSWNRTRIWNQTPGYTVKITALFCLLWGPEKIQKQSMTWKETSRHSYGRSLSLISLSLPQVLNFWYSLRLSLLKDRRKALEIILQSLKNHWRSPNTCFREEALDICQQNFSSPHPTETLHLPKIKSIFLPICDFGQVTEPRLASVSSSGEAGLRTEPVS